MLQCLIYSCSMHFNCLLTLMRRIRNILYARYTRAASKCVQTMQLPQHVWWCKYLGQIVSHRTFLGLGQLLRQLWVTHSSTHLPVRLSVCPVCMADFNVCCLSGTVVIAQTAHSPSWPGFDAHWWHTRWYVVLKSESHFFLLRQQPTEETFDMLL